MAPRRRNFFSTIFEDFQIRLVVTILLISLCVSAFLGFKLYIQEKEKSQILQIQNESISALVQDFDRGLFFFVLMIIILQATGLFFLIMHATQKVVGPIARIERELNQAMQDNVPVEIKPVRKDDEFQSFFKALKAYIDQFKN